jgi:hypothetical protein
MDRVLDALACMAKMLLMMLPQGDFGPCSIQIINLTAFDEKNMVCIMLGPYSSFISV